MILTVAGNEQPMPDVVGLPQELATRTSRPIPVNVQGQGRDSGTRQTGDVLDALPAPGEKLSAGGIVTMTVVKAPS